MHPIGFQYQILWLINQTLAPSISLINLITQITRVTLVTQDRVYDIINCSRSDQTCFSKVPFPRVTPVCWFLCSLQSGRDLTRRYSSSAKVTFAVSRGRGCEASSRLGNAYFGILRASSGERKKRTWPALPRGAKRVFSEQTDKIKRRLYTYKYV